MDAPLYPDDPAYPRLLAAIDSPPPIWVRGELLPDDALAIAIVGSRRSTAYGAEVAERLGEDLGARGVTIVSGLARGIDAAAHRGALAAGGRTIAVLGCGTDIVYPPENGALMAEIPKSGALVSQFPPGTPPRPFHFPIRNRVIAGLALGVVVVEAADRSGALITARLATDFGREVFAVPGRITSDTSLGTHGLLRDGATLVRDWADVVSELPSEWRRLVRGVAPDGVQATAPAVSSDDSRVLALLSPDEPQHIEQLIALSGLPPAHIGRSLVALELGGWARQLEGQRWVVARRGHGKGDQDRRY